MLRIKLVLSSVILLFFGGGLEVDAKDEMTRSQIDSLKKVGYGFASQEPELAIEYANDQLQASKEIRYYEGTFDAYYQTAYAYKAMKKYDKAIENYFKAIYQLENEAIPNYTGKKMHALCGIAYCYDKSFVYTTSFQYYEEALEIALLKDDSAQISSIYYSLGRQQEMQANYASAIKYYKGALSYLKPSEKKEYANIYNSIGNINSYVDEYDVANEYYHMALELNSTALYKSNLGDNYYDQQLYDSAIYYFQQALIESERNGNEKINLIRNNLGDVYSDMGDYQKAIYYYAQTIDEFDQQSIDKEYRRACKNISEAYEKIDDYQNALKYQDLYIVQSESIAQLKENLQEQNSIYRMKEMEWQMERRAKDERLSTNELIIFWLKLGSIALAIVLSIAGYQAVRYYKGIRHVKKWLAAE